LSRTIASMIACAGSPAARSTFGAGMPCRARPPLRLIERTLSKYASHIGNVAFGSLELSLLVRAHRPIDRHDRQLAVDRPSVFRADIDRAIGFVGAIGRHQDFSHVILP